MSRCCHEGQVKVINKDPIKVTVVNESETGNTTAELIQAGVDSANVTLVDSLAALTAIGQNTDGVESLLSDVITAIEGIELTDITDDDIDTEYISWTIIGCVLNQRVYHATYTTNKTDNDGAITPQVTNLYKVGANGEVTTVFPEGLDESCLSSSGVSSARLYVENCYETPDGVVSTSGFVTIDAEGEKTYDLVVIDSASTSVPVGLPLSELPVDWVQTVCPFKKKIFRLKQEPTGTLIQIWGNGDGQPHDIPANIFTGSDYLGLPTTHPSGDPTVSLTIYPEGTPSYYAEYSNGELIPVNIDLPVQSSISSWIHLAEDMELGLMVTGDTNVDVYHAELGGETKLIYQVVDNDPINSIFYSLGEFTKGWHYFNSQTSTLDGVGALILTTGSQEPIFDLPMQITEPKYECVIVDSNEELLTTDIECEVDLPHPTRSYIAAQSSASTSSTRQVFRLTSGTAPDGSGIPQDPTIGLKLWNSSVAAAHTNPQYIFFGTGTMNVPSDNIGGTYTLDAHISNFDLTLAATSASAGGLDSALAVSGNNFNKWIPSTDTLTGTGYSGAGVYKWESDTSVVTPSASFTSGDPSNIKIIDENTGSSTGITLTNTNIYNGISEATPVASSLNSQLMNDGTFNTTQYVAQYTGADGTVYTNVAVTTLNAYTVYIRRVGTNANIDYIYMAEVRVDTSGGLGSVSVTNDEMFLLSTKDITPQGMFDAHGLTEDQYYFVFGSRLTYKDITYQSFVDALSLGDPAGSTSGGEAIAVPTGNTQFIMEGWVYAPYDYYPLGIDVTGSPSITVYSAGNGENVALTFSDDNLSDGIHGLGNLRKGWNFIHIQGSDANGTTSVSLVISEDGETYVPLSLPTLFSKPEYECVTLEENDVGLSTDVTCVIDLLNIPRAYIPPTRPSA